ncbi:hypothetical protein ACLM45_13645 [Synechococcus sp. A10-1-5-9]|uniref:hypothetical protein n=1 Tax=Synechococcus sp. A10-1-5-9 TaxID=3392295 RepID=UPI0039E8BC4F
MGYQRTLSAEQLHYAERWERLRSVYFASLGPHYEQIAADCAHAADWHLSRLRSIEEEAA